MNGIFFKIIPKGKVAEHFNLGMVSGSMTHVFQVIMLAAGAHTTLTGGSPGVSSVFFSHENPLELHHAGVGKKQGRVILRYQGGAVDYCMIFGCKKIEKS